VSKYYITVVYFSNANRPFLAERSTSVLTDNMPARRGVYFFNIILWQKCDISLMDNYGVVSLGVIICSIIIAYFVQKCAIIIFIIAHFDQKCAIIFSL
jgi:hypothetical protein